MADKVYQSRNISVNAPQLQARQEQTFDKQVGAVADVITSKFNNLAAENYAMGNAVAINTSIQKAYEAAPADPKRFQELVRTNINAFQKNLPSNISNDLENKYLSASGAALTKVEANQKQKQIEVYKKNNQTLLNQNVGQYNFALSGEFQASVDRDDKNKETLINARRNAYNVQLKLADSQLPDGTYLYTDKQRKDITSKDGQYEAFQNAIYGSNYAQLKSYDDEVFQDREKFMTDHDIDANTYDKMSNLMKQRRKALDDSDKREIKAQTYFDAQQSIMNQDPVAYNTLMDNDVMDESDKKTMDIIKNVYDDKNTTRQGVKDALMLEKTLIALNDASQNVNSQDSQERAIQAYSNFANQFQNLATSTGMDVDDKQNTLKLATKQFTDPLFAQAIKPAITDTTALGSLIQKKAAQEYLSGDKSIDIKQYSGDKVKTELQKSLDSAEKSALDYGQNQVKAAVNYGMAGDIDTMNKIISDANRKVMKIRNSPFIDSNEFDRLENEFNNKRPAITKIAGVLYEFKGYSQMSPIFAKKD